MKLQSDSPPRTELLRGAVEAAKSAGRFLLSRFGRNSRATYNEAHDLKIEEDAKAEEIIRLCLSDLTEYGFIGEESYINAASGPYVWVVDPLDGTANYARGIPHFSSSIALCEEGVPVLGVVRNHYTGETITAIQDEGAWCDGISLKVSATDSLGKSIMAGGFMKTEEMVGANHGFMSEAAGRMFKIRVTGSAALDLCNVAMGRFDIYSEMGIKIWDIAAGILIAKEAGASVSVSRVDDVSFNATVLTPGLGDEFAAAFPGTAPLTREVPELIEKNVKW